MRRLPRLRGPASALSSSTCSLRTPISSHTGATAATFSASSQCTSQHISSAAAATRSSGVWPHNSLQQRCLSTTTPRCASTKPPAATTEVAAAPPLPESELGAFDEEVDLEFAEQEQAAVELETDLVYPRENVEVPREKEVTDPDYVPVESGEGLEVVGGFKDWWDRPGHWGESKKYVGFGPRERVAEPAVLEVLARRAVVEALAIQHYSSQTTATKEQTARALQAVVEPEQILDIAEVELVPGENDTVAVKDQEDLRIVWEVLTKAEPSTVPADPDLSVQEAREVGKAWGSEWKKAAVQDPVLKFYIAKRLQRLTGHLLTDAKLASAGTIGAIVAQLIRKPKPAKLAEQLEQKGQLADLPNVTVHARRVTPIDKEQMMGRWKLIRQELENRELPLTGTGKYTRQVEYQWARGEGAARRR